MVSDVSGYTGSLSHVTFKLYNTATHGIETFKPLREGQVSIYHCGMTVQSSPHLGHIRKEVVFDVLRRWLECSVVTEVTDRRQRHRYRRQDPRQVRRTAGVPWWAHAYEFENELHAGLLKACWDAAHPATSRAPPATSPR